MLRMLAALAAGVLLGGIALIAITGDGGHAWIIGVALPFLILSLTLVSVGKSLRGASGLSTDRAEALLAQGLGALARIESVERTGTSVNDAPLCRLELVVAPHDTDAYRTTTKLLIDPVRIPQFQPGAVLTVARLRADAPEVAVVREPDHEWRRRMTEEAHRIPDASRVHDWRSQDPSAVSAPGERPLIGIGRSGRAVRLAVYAVLLVVGAGGVLWLNVDAVRAGSGDVGNTAAPTTVEQVSPSGPPNDFVTGDGQQRAVDALIELTGDTRFISLHFTDDRVSSEAPSEPGALTIDDYAYADGQAVHEGPDLIQPDHPAEALFDITEVDVTVFPALLDRAREVTGITEPVSASVLVMRDGIGVDPITGEQTEIRMSVSVSDDYYRGWIDADADGEVFAMYSTKPESQAYDGG